MPCSGPMFPDNEGKLQGYVEGWGNDADSSGKCMTNEEDLDLAVHTEKNHVFMSNSEITTEPV